MARMFFLSLMAFVWGGAAWAQGGEVAPAPSRTPFRTDVMPRVDPVFGDVTSLRSAVDRFLALETEMNRARDRFSTAVHGTLVLVGSLGAPPVGKTRAAQTKSRVCPPGVMAQYRIAEQAGRDYLVLGHNLEARYREIRRAAQGGDVVGLTPDYRTRVGKVNDMYLSLLRDLREMRLSFHDQLGAELRAVGCTPGGVRQNVAPEKGQTVDLRDPTVWNLEEPPVRGVVENAAPSNLEPDGAPSVWIEVDNSRCNEASQVTIDGTRFGDVPAGKKTPVRVRSGPRALCILPVAGGAKCGAPGTVRRTYLYEGLTLAVRCAQ